MQNLRINKKALCSLFLTGTIALNTVGCTREIVKNKKNNANIEVVEQVEPSIRQKAYVNKYGLIVNLSDMNDHAYIVLDENTKYTLCDGANVYFKGEWNIDAEEINDKPIIVTGIESNGKYTFIELPTGEKAYVDNGYLVKCANINKTAYVNYPENTYSKLNKDAYLYGNSGIYLRYLYCDEVCRVNATNGEYSYITLNDGTNGYVLNDVLVSNYQKVNGSAFVAKDTRLYSDKGLSNVYRITDDEIIYVEYITDRYAVIYDSQRNVELYLNPAMLDGNFIDVKLASQRMDCYLDYQVTGSWNIRSGKDGTPTCEGAYDIDEKVSDWEFTTFPGSYAKHWIPISTETQQGIHDLVGDDEENYGNESYHTYGSHGCIRVPRDASQFVYDNYNIGDMVLVRKK